MLGSVRMAAWFLNRRKLHDFNACVVRIVGIQTIFPVPPDFRPIECFVPSRSKFSCGGVNIFHAERKMILHTKFFVVGVRRNVEHVFDPVGTVRHLQFVPVRTVVFETAPPVKTKPQELHVKAVLGSQIFDDKTRMDHPQTGLFG